MALHRFRAARIVRPDASGALSRGSVLPFLAGAAGIAILLFTYYRITWRSFAHFQVSIDRASGMFSDFTGYYYPMGEAVIRTGLPVEGFLYSPFIAVLLAVFPPLGLEASLVVWGMLQVAGILLCLLLFRMIIPGRLWVQLLFAALFLSSFALLHNLDYGQVAMFILAALLGALALYQRGRRFAGTPASCSWQPPTWSCCRPRCTRSTWTYLLAENKKGLRNAKSPKNLVMAGRSPFVRRGFRARLEREQCRLVSHHHGDHLPGTLDPTRSSLGCS